MSLLITGSIGIDTVETPHGRAADVIGGTAVYSSLAAAPYGPVRLVGVVGEDFPEDALAPLQAREIDLSGLERRAGSKTFRWTGKYEGSMNEAETVNVSLNVLAEAGPKVPAAFADSRTVFLANTHPTLQRDLLDQVRDPWTVVCDTMNLWIENERESLLTTLAKVTGVILNDGEARMLTGVVNVIEAGAAILGMGPEFVVIKKGEHGSVLMTGEAAVAMPALPTREVCDPTGAGDSFAGGFLGYLNTQPKRDLPALKRAVARGTVAASFTIEDFSIRRLVDLTRDQIDARVKSFLEMLRVE
jgi:sugar/nucleoside kinase (ribokinase family)